MPRTSFLRYEFGILSINAALATRDDENPIYSNIPMHKRKPFKGVVRQVLGQIDVDQGYINGGVSEQTHCNFIEEVSHSVSSTATAFLYNRRFRIGIAQKLVNLYLKYLWCAGLILEPPHCPIDGIIRERAGLTYNWVKSDNIEEYKLAISEIRNLSNRDNLSIAEWELRNFRRRDEQ
jgi:hypothetical protein